MLGCLQWGKRVVKVLVVQDSLRPAGGSETVVTRAVAGLREAGCMPVVVCRDGDPSLLADIPIREVPDIFGPSAREAFAALEAVMKRERPDLVHIHKVAAPAMIGLAAQRLPTIVTVHDHAAYCPGGSKVFWRTGAVCTRPLGVPCLIHAYAHRCAARHPLRLWRQFQFSLEAMSALQRAHRVLTLSGYVRERLLQSGLGSDHVTVLAPWVEMPPATAPKEGESVLFAGRLTREKGVEALLRALSLVPIPVEAVIAGDGPLRRSCEQLASQLSVDRSLQFRGWLSAAALKEEYARCAFLVLPSLWPEPFGMVGPEAMAYGKPVVAFDGGGVRDWLIHGVNGLLVPKGDTRGLATAMGQLLVDPELRAQLGAAARDHVMERFNRKLHISGLVARYRELLN
jgi:glycosyltransferase involved in cell wall biosynthesis